MSNYKGRQYGVIGTGLMGQEHMRCLQHVQGANLVAVADPVERSRDWAKSVLHEIGSQARVYERWEEMVERESLDAVIIATPNFTHYQIIDELMQTDLGLMIEKPLCTTLDDARDVHKRASKRQALTHVGLEYRYMPPVARFIERAHRGDIGAVHSLSIREHRFPFLPKVGDWNRFNQYTGGTLVEKCCHFFDLMRLILKQEAVRVFASAGQDVNHLDERYDGRTPDIIDNALVIVEFNRGARAVLDLCMFAEGSQEQEEVSLVGSEGKLEVCIPGGTVTLSPRDKSGPIDEHIPVAAELMKAGHHHGATVYHLRAFHQALVSGEAAPIGTLDGLRSVQIGLAAQQSVETGQAIDLGGDEILPGKVAAG